VLKRLMGYVVVRSEPAPEASQLLEDQGYALLRGALPADEVEKLAAEINAIYAAVPPDLRGRRTAEQLEPYRYEMLNRSALCQRAVGSPAILEVIEPLLGEDCHVIANTAWRDAANPEEGARGGPWHIDAGPHVPRAEGIPWDDRIPYPIFAIGAHILLQDCPLACGPTGVIPGSHRSGRVPPFEQLFDAQLRCQGQQGIALEGRSGDVALFVSDAWHRRLPTTRDDRGRFFLQVHYGRRDIAQRLRTTEQVNQLSEHAIARAESARERQLVGLHEPFFYDG
jgi:ectoine hydroxylase-related dioxygenase (phytanoyl-CoA dioxygenase family)